ncbi:nucleotide-diphospho-sugar transferase [Mycena crocata]|nr:nucleotide-diphospho-sugar transferase [Mycena crocata]
MSLVGFENLSDSPDNDQLPRDPPVLDFSQSLENWSTIPGLEKLPDSTDNDQLYSSRRACTVFSICSLLLTPARRGPSEGINSLMEDNQESDFGNSLQVVAVPTTSYAASEVLPLSDAGANPLEADNPFIFSGQIQSLVTIPSCSSSCDLKSAPMANVFTPDSVPKSEHKCHLCHQVFSLSKHLKRHLLIHDPKRPTYPCPRDSCGRSFKWKQGLDLHLKYKSCGRDRHPKSPAVESDSDLNSKAGSLKEGDPGLAGVLLLVWLAWPSSASPNSPSRVLTRSPAPNQEYTAAVVYLLTTTPETSPRESLFRSLVLTQKNVPCTNQWPILLFHADTHGSPRLQSGFFDGIRKASHENNVSADDTKKLMKRIEFVALHHNLPVGIPANVHQYKPLYAGHWPGYHHMCAFFSYKIFQHPRIKDLTYYLRLDDDSFIREPLCFDPFEFMHINNKSFAFRNFLMDAAYAQRNPEVENQLLGNGWEWAPDRSENDNYGHGLEFPAYGGNFEIVKPARFRTPEMTAFLNELASDPGRFYHNRWTDSPVRAAAVYMFLNVTGEVYEMCEIAYQHKSRTEYNTCDCVPLPSVRR